MKAFVIVAAFAALCAGAAYAEPTIEPTDCAQFVEIAEGITAECGILRVPENRANPQSRTIGIPYLRLRSPAENPGDPVIIMSGGPGNRSMPRRVRSDPFLAERDVINLEQRGTMLTQPALQCPEYIEARRRILLGRIDRNALIREQAAAARTCANRARAEGVDLAGYTSAEIAADIEDLRRLLGYERLNLYGLSYSGRVMTQYARDYPAPTRSLVLNTPMPIEINYDEHGSAGMRRTLNMLFDACAIDAACARTYPSLREEFRTIISAARRRRPVEVSVEDVNVRVTDWVLANALLDQLYEKGSIEQLPRRIHALASGDLGELAQILDTGATNQAWLMRITVWCNEEYPFEDQAAIARQHTDYPEFGGVDQWTVPPGVCEAMGLNANPPARENEPAQIAAPVLIISGAMDPAVPPPMHTAMARHMPAAQVAIFPWSGHGAGFSRCGFEITMNFLAAPDASVDTSCLSREPGLDFTATP